MAKQNTTPETETPEVQDKSKQIEELQMQVETLTQVNEELSMQLAVTEKAKGEGKKIVKIGKKSYVAKFPTIRLKGEVFNVEDLEQEQLEALLEKGTFFEKD